MRFKYLLNHSRLITTSLLVLLFVSPALAQVDYSREIRPLLAKRCYSCHGPGEQESGLRVDTEASIKSELESGEHAIISGKPAGSELIARITSDDEFTRMPPEGKPLTDQEVKLLEQWISEGAHWESHWAFKDVARPEPPSVKQQDWIKTPIDAFVLDRLEQNNLSPNPQATKLQLIRRATYNLTGLPPSQSEVEAFLNDESSNAFEKVVDRLLDSPRYGEHWARHWLDIVRYAETNSFERDSLKPHAWRYRDYVIRSFNDDKPYYQFVREQLAGDEIDEVTPDSIIATGYYRLGIWDDEPADRLLAVYDNLDDLVSTTGQAFLALTINCARCHDHKIDPITQADYYSMASFFNGINPMARGGGPNIERAIFENEAARQEYENKVQELNEQRNAVQAKVRAIEDEFREKYKQISLAEVQQPDLANLKYRFYRDTFKTLPDFDNLKAETEESLDPPYFDIRPATREDFFGFVFEGELIVPEDGKYTFWLDSDDGARLLIDGKKLIEYDGIHGVGKPHQKPLELKAGRVAIRLEYFQGQHGKGLAVRWSGPKFRDRYLSATTADNVLLSELSSRPLPELMRISGRKVLGPKRFKHYNDLKKEMNQLFGKKIPSDYALAVTEVSEPPEMHIMNRGNPRLVGDKVTPSFPVLLTSIKPYIEKTSSNTSGRRRALADWMTSPDNKMTARVIVNRIWQHQFGRGIVRSSNNFGLLGSAPTHPKLLDWLASDFMDHGWTIKRVQKMILMSNTWQQSSTPNPDAYAIDPTNDQFWKHDMRRLNAEEIRDSLYAATGELNVKMYGPGIYPIIPAAILAGQSQPGSGWGDSSPEERARRSVYIHIKRSLITPFLAEFDFCETDSSCADRFSTVQPTQALGMLNSEFVHERALVLADRLQRDHPDNLDAQIRHSIWLACQRPATEGDLERGRKLVKSLKSEHGLNDEQALDLYSLMIVNLNEFMYLD
ncbi:DUF1549 domain-containing protein [Planctomycetaceae bacterium]|nr:DUF1549 domain-containing protein [Planctomycetaceae bacterium]MDC0273444.1 DUF1549 domain-containing protein [Planctomycetaceae bacterium]MDG2390702.1 DUF1549 domain-containing protein [Planctomycetaceae bacterium]